MPNTTNRSYPYPARGTKPYFSEIVAFFDAVDNDVQAAYNSIDTKVSTLQEAYENGNTITTSSSVLELLTGGPNIELGSTSGLGGWAIQYSGPTLKPSFNANMNAGTITCDNSLSLIAGEVGATSTISFKDTFLTSVITLSESGVTGLDSAISATSIIGAINEVKISGQSSPLLKRVDTGAWELPVNDVEYYAGYKNGAQAYYKQTTVPILADASTVIDSDFYTNGFTLDSHRFYCVNDADPSVKYPVPLVGTTPTFETPTVSNSLGLIIIRAGTGAYPGWSYIGGYTYFKYSA